MYVGIVFHISRHVALNFSKPPKLINNYTVTRGRNPWQFVIWYHWRRSVEPIDISVITVAVKFYL